MQHKTLIQITHTQFLSHLHTYTQHTHMHSQHLVQTCIHHLVSAQLAAADPAAREAPTIQILRRTRSSSSSAWLPSSHSLFASHSFSFFLWMLTPSSLCGVMCRSLSVLPLVILQPPLSLTLSLSDSFKTCTCYMLPLPHFNTQLHTC